jgi:hypothetical protein
MCCEREKTFYSEVIKILDKLKTIHDEALNIFSHPTSRSKETTTLFYIFSKTSNSLALSLFFQFEDTVLNASISEHSALRL